MELRKGYKQTEIGVIPENWQIVTIKDIASNKKKWSFTGGPFGSNLKSSDYTNDGVRIIQLQNIGDGQFLDDYSIFTSNEKANELLSCNIYPGDLILSKMGDPVARACLIPDLHKRYLMCSDGIRLAIDEFQSTYFYYCFINSPIFRKQAEESSTGSTRKRIGLTELKNLLLVKPSEAEQAAIAKALSDADAWIQSLTRLIAKKRQIKQGAMQTLLNPYENGKLKDGWQIKKIGQLAKVQRGASPRPIDSPMWFDNNSSVGWLRISDVTKSNKYLFNTTQKLSQQGINNSRLVKSGNLIMSICATVGRPVLNETDVCIHDGFVVFSELLADKEYLYYYLTKIEREWDKHGQTGSQMNLNTNLINSADIPIPVSLNAQSRIASIFSLIDKEIEFLSLKLSKANKIKQGMMQNLLTGRMRLI